MGPDWLGSPQHVVAGIVLAAALVVVGVRLGLNVWVAAALAIGLTSAAELVVEVFEYFALYSGSRSVGSYWDTIADLASTLVGALIGAGGAIVFARG